MQRAARGLDTPAGTVGQELAAEKLFAEFLQSTGLTTTALDEMHASFANEAALPTQNFYSLLTAFSIFLQTKKSSRARSGLLAKSTALGYFSQILNMLRERYPTSLSDSQRVAKIRDKMASSIAERNLRTNVQTNDAPGCTVNDLCLIVEHLIVNAKVASGLKSVHDAALLNMMWHTFGRAIDTCFARKQQLSMAASGELFLHIARIKTSVVQGVSIFKSPARWQQCMLHSFGLLFVCYDEPSEFLFPLVPRYTTSDLPGQHTYSQEEAVVYWESLEDKTESTTQPPPKRERKRPNVASYITEVIRDELKEMPLSFRQSITPDMTSHSIRRGSAAYANASPKLAIQWISTRGAWLLESLTKAFAYIGTTTKEDQSVGKVLAGYEAPDLPVVTPSIRDLHDRLSVVEFGQVITLRDELFRHVLGLPDVRYNVAQDVVDASFAALLMHLEEVIEATRKCCASPAQVSRYLYELERGLTSTNVRLGSSVTVSRCCEWGEHLREHWRIVNHAHIGKAGAGDEKKLGSVLESMLGQLVSINERLARLEEAHASLLARTQTQELSSAEHIEDPTVSLAGAPLFAATPAQATSSTLAGCFLNWYVSHIWQTVKGKREQNKRAEVKAAVNIMMVLYQMPFEVLAEPSKADAVEFQSWKNSLWQLALKMDATANERLHAFDHKKPTRKPSSLRKRWRKLRRRTLMHSVPLDLNTSRCYLVDPSLMLALLVRTCGLRQSCWYQIYPEPCTQTLIARNTQTHKAHTTQNKVKQ